MENKRQVESAAGWIGKIERAYQPCLTADGTKKITPELWWAVKYAAGSLREIALTCAGQMAVFAERIAALERENAELRKERDGLRSFKNSVDESLNSGTGVYKP